MPTITEDIRNVWVLWWQPSDGKGDGNVKRAYEGEGRANSDRNLVKDHPSKNYYLDNIQFYEGQPHVVENMEDIINVWVLWWAPLSGKGTGCVERVYEEEGRASEDYALAEDHPTRKYFLDSILLYRRPVGINTT